MIVPLAGRLLFVSPELQKIGFKTAMKWSNPVLFLIAVLLLFTFHFIFKAFFVSTWRLSV